MSPKQKSFLLKLSGPLLLVVGVFNVFESIQDSNSTSTPGTVIHVITAIGFSLLGIFLCYAHWIKK
jgi:hypothetical protein